MKNTTKIRNQNQVFLIDTADDVSVIQQTRHSGLYIEKTTRLSASNGAEICIFCKRCMNLDLRRSIPWTFMKFLTITDFWSIYIYKTKTHQYIYTHQYIHHNSWNHFLGKPRAFLLCTNQRLCLSRYWEDQLRCAWYDFNDFSCNQSWTEGFFGSTCFWSLVVSIISFLLNG